MDLKAAFGPLFEDWAKIRRERGEEAYQQERLDFVRRLVTQGPLGEKFAGEMFPDVTPSVEEAPADPTVVSPREANHDAARLLFTEAARLSFPSLRTQAQFDSLLVSIDALRGVADAIFSLDAARTLEMRDALLKSIDALVKVTEISEKLREVPEAATSLEAERFKQAPAQFTEAQAQSRLLSELSRIEDVDTLGSWYLERRAEMDRVVTPQYRNPLFDAIREKRAALKSSPSGQGEHR